MRGRGRYVAWGVLLSASVSAQSVFNVRAEGAKVFLNEQLIVWLKSGRNAERAQTVVNSFRKLTETSQLRTEPADRSVQILDGDRVVLTATTVEARAHKLTPAALANQWFNRLRRAMTASPVTIPSDRITLAAGARRTLALGGYRVRSAQVQSEDPEIVLAQIQDGKLLLQAVNLGSSVVAIRAGEAEKFIRVEVLATSMSFPQSVEVSVTGDPVSNDILQGALEGALWTQLKSAPEASYSFRVPAVPSLRNEQAVTLTVPVVARAPGALEASGNVAVTLRHEAIAYKAESVLWYCNDPESVRGPRNLFGARLKRNEPVRMLYHHINDSYSPLFVEVMLVNESSQAARVLVIPGDSPPDKNPVRAGLVAGNQLLRNWLRYSGEVVTIPPRSQVPVALRRLALQDTMSGLCYLRLISGPPELLVRTDAREPYSLSGRLDAALQSSTPWRRLGALPLDYAGAARVQMSDLVFPWPFREEVVNYAVGGRHAFIRLGQKPIPRPNGRGLDGNFGVFYSIDATLENPQSETADLEVVFEASAGYSGALFAYNGEVLRTPLLQPKEEARIARLSLVPGERKRISMMTVPLSGSSYPATLVIRPVGSGSGNIRAVIVDRGQGP